MPLPAPVTIAVLWPISFLSITNQQSPSTRLGAALSNVKGRKSAISATP